MRIVMAIHAAARPANSAQRTVNAASSIGRTLRRLVAAAALDAKKTAAPTNPRMTMPTRRVEIAPAMPIAAAPAPAATRCGNAPLLRHSRAVWSAAIPAAAE
jgi:hypothetical protein